jgi:hypothetical protein
MRRLTTALVLALCAVPALAQNRTSTPRTPWGDPDLQGDYTNKYEQGTPFERPAEFNGRRIEDITGDELATLVRERAAELLLNAPFTGGDAIAGNFGGAPAFYDRFEAARGSRPWFVIDPPDGRIPPMTADGARAAAARTAARTALRKGRGPSDSYTDRSLYDRCITRGLPGSMMPANYGNSYRIIQSPGFVTITYEMVHETRIIPLDPSTGSGSPRAESRGDGRLNLPAVFRHYMGEPRGRWDGDTLVVETTNFRDEAAYRNANPETLRLIERFRPSGPDAIEWSVTVDDPSTWTRPWTFAMPLTRNSREAVLEYACHEGNMAMANLLTAARAEERAARATSRAPASARDAEKAPAAPAVAAVGLSGEWRIAGNRPPNFAGYSAASRMAIADSGDTVNVQTDTGTEGQFQTTVYRLDGREAPVPGPVGWSTVARATRENGRVVVVVTRTIDGPEGKVTFTITDSYSESAGVLTLERTQGPRKQVMTYRREP